MSKRGIARGKDARQELRFSRSEKLIVVGWVLVMLTLLYFIVPRNAQRSVEHVGAHAGRQPSDTAARRAPKAVPKR